MSEKSRFTKIVPVAGKWYLYVEGGEGSETTDAIYPIAAWGECSTDGSIIGLSTIGKYQPAELMGPPPGFKCYYLSEDEMTDDKWKLLKSTTNFLRKKPRFPL